MKPVLAMALVAGLVAAQDVTQIPDCAKGCVNKFVAGTSIADCKTADVACICKNTSFLDDIACCLQGVCNQADQDRTVEFAKKICGASGVQVPGKVECKQGPASSSSGSASSSSQTGTASGSSSTASAAASSGSATRPSSTSPSTSSPTTGAAAGIGSGSVGSVVGAVLAVLAAL